MNTSDPGDDEVPWRIDELASRSGIGVDTIRFYQREGLLPPAQRQGRAMFYGPSHLRALERVKDLQAKHFSIGAIRTLAAEGRLALIEMLFDVSESGESEGPQPREPGEPDLSLLADLAAVGLVEPGGDGDHDSVAVRAAADLLLLGMPRELLLLLVRIYVDAFARIEDDILSQVTGPRPVVPRKVLTDFASGDPERLTHIVPLVEVVMRHAHSRALRHVVQDAIESIAGGAR